jgi:hypothetical protein
VILDILRQNRTAYQIAHECQNAEARECDRTGGTQVIFVFVAIAEQAYQFNETRQSIQSSGQVAHVFFVDKR